MVDRNLFLRIDNLEKLLPASQLVIGNVMYVFRIVVKCGTTSAKFLSYVSQQYFRALLGQCWGHCPGPYKGPVQVRSPEA